MGSKRAKLEEGLGEGDRISKLPDEVLIHILSLLEDSELAVQTSILSRRWKNLWKSISCIRLGDADHVSDDNFMTLADRVVTLHNSNCILKFDLTYVNDGTRDGMLFADHTSIRKWICSLVQHSVADVRLNLEDDDGIMEDDDGNHYPFLIPECLYMCTTLAALKVKSNVISFSNCPREGCFPSLKVLEVNVDESEQNSPSSLENLFRCCPKLEGLTIDGIFSESEITIAAPKLKTLKMYCSRCEFNIFSINAPKLENLDIIDSSSLPNGYNFEGGVSLKKVKLTLRHDDEDFDADRALALVTQISKVEDLFLSLQDFNAARFPQFVNLSRLVLVLHGFSYGEYLIQCLNRCPILKNLILELKDNTWGNTVGELEWQFSNPPECPACLVSHLQTISIKGFKGQKDEMDVARFLLKNGVVLTTMSIHCVTEGLLSTKEDLRRELLKLVGGSKPQVIFID